MVGDTPFDLDMAQRAGVPSVAVGHGFSSQAAMAAYGPTAYAPDTAALRDILLAWSRLMTLTHLDPEGRPRMVDVSAKAVTRRRAVAAGYLALCPECAEALEGGGGPKGDPWTTARIGAIGGAKRTGDLIPLAHPLALDAVTVDHHWDAGLRRAWLRVEVSVEGRTGVEMEALAGVSRGAPGPL